ncbi:MAG: Mo-dependent nitrogenase C-terminal domain-containing protein [Fischerella sp. CENA71]|nr:Mo-dependent nitrogenase C-terminal domain-containing protein [Fischerella sp. CENA71]
MLEKIIMWQKVYAHTKNFFQSANLLETVRHWLESIEIHEPTIARILCKIIPANCPFERKIKLFGITVFRIPPLCKINPVYQQIINLRYKSLSYLVDECGEDITPYC